MRDLLPASLPIGRRSPPCYPDTSTATLFLIARKADGFSARTLTKYHTGLADLQAFAQANGFPPDPLQFDPVHIRCWVADLRDRRTKSNPPRQLSPSTQWTYWMSARMFYKWAASEGYIKRSPCEHIRGPKQDSQVITPLSQEQIEMLLRLCPPGVWWGARDRAIITLLLTTGIRRQELVGLQLEDLDFDAGIIRVSGKGDQRYRCKERTLAILPQVLSPLLGWLRWRHQMVLDHGLHCSALFLQCYRQAWQPITGNAVQRMMRRLAQTAGIEGVRVSAHTVRHTFSITCARNHLPKRSLQDLLGHRDPRSTEIYTRYVDHEQVLDEIRQDNPFKHWKRLW